MAPEVSEAAAGASGPVRLADEAAARTLHGQGWRIRVLSSYSVSVGQGSAELHSLADVAEFVCAQCREWCEATLVAIRRRHLVCPGCFGAQPQAAVPPAVVPRAAQPQLSQPQISQSQAAAHGEAVPEPATSFAGVRRAPWSVHAARPCRRQHA
ncbi:hypothetical protein LY13_000044 [Prauserella aidingensis]|nr:hypothetical protein [Prauserella aidingensis]